ncbi:LLM class flavin-dependent oxidoreductase [Mucilaginibacter myungsuensis]|uniref:Luciferase-like monooxygenase n=1 Tax=Mucilaginibacter myungsuensis TaxID=649104 RepID=A0A929PW03_9SPHI|nr:LLM class flavin-dependent oxidoreductase [Mucilaginibacter myungsuensis]MBE9661566.1 LLM class flavin-dependent oxidoreductase [Mucilaginibacter myungsuensis]MDN3597709.1 LLM class flavin-dependent oxidoreductase [Mucilaginibacter myungsuensis]
MSSKKLRLSVLDQSPIRKGATAIQAVQETIQLAKFTEQLGYTRFWVAEHHNTGILAGSSPDVLLAHLAAHTSTIRLGSGGVMLPNHSALKVAESFRMLEALAPGRIDLGMGRAPGTDRVTASILNPSNQFREQDFVEQLADLQNYFHDTADPGTIHRSIRAIPQVDTVPAMWLLSSSGQSGLFAAHFGMGFSFAHFINPVGGPQAVKLYRDRFQPSDDLTEPEANMAIFLFCSEDPEKVVQFKAVMDARFLQFEKGVITPLSYNDVKDVVYTEAEQDRIRYNRQRVVAGSPTMVKERLNVLAENYDIDEIMVVTICEDFDDRLRSYGLLAELFELEKLS